jgi:hypothetical protein
MANDPLDQNEGRMHLYLMRALSVILIFLALGTSASTRPQPSLVPDGWHQEFADAETRTRRFVSPDGRSSLTTRQTVANRQNLSADMDRIALHDGERITYQSRGRSWIAVSGYRNGDIFYRKSNLACRGTRWNHVELVYPRENKRAMDAPVTQIARGMTLYGSDCN